MITKSLDAIAKMTDSAVLDESFKSTIITGVCIDSRKAEKGNLFIPIKGENADGHQFIHNAIANGCVATLWDKNEPNPPENIGVIAVDDTVKALQRLAEAYRSTLDIKVIGISGSNGKTSTKDILAGILSIRYKTQKTMGNYNNELGVPLTILSFDEDCQAAVVEMGLEKKGELLFLKNMVKPNIGILTNVGPIHIENFNCVEEIADAKLELIECLDENGLFIYNGDDKLINGAIKKIKFKDTMTVKTFGMQNNNDLYCSDVSQDEHCVTFNANGEVNDTFSINILGKHQAVNALSAIIAAKQLNLSNSDIKEGLQRIEKTGLRNELIKIRKCTVLDDSYKSNPISLLSALDTFEVFNSPKKIVVLGDMVGLGKDAIKLHCEIGEKLSDYTVDELVTFGPLAKNIAEGAKNIVKSIKMFDDKDEMTEYLSKYLDEDCMMLVKASRAIALDEVVKKLSLK